MVLAAAGKDQQESHPRRTHWQAPEFEEYTIVLAGACTCSTKGENLTSGLDRRWSLTPANGSSTQLPVKLPSTSPSVCRRSHQKRYIATRSRRGDVTIIGVEPGKWRC